jgi:hypothetical protein
MCRKALAHDGLDLGKFKVIREVTPFPLIRGVIVQLRPAQGLDGAVSALLECPSY